ncbi:Hypothetical protein NTJ_10989 [Nesidiocoris tenuis]|uniref:Uncharacterized protein n=1 Tax=Nesidiocoris tenuis TaxID=355587 RepID=A0ABN7B3J8_9HEMI|nr:Hypothetical protein NTJ_10989 [Nesidiocoris tenuis]
MDGFGIFNAYLQLVSRCWRECIASDIGGAEQEMQRLHLGESSKRMLQRTGNARAAEDRPNRALHQVTGQPIDPAGRARSSSSKRHQALDGTAANSATCLDC